MQIGACCVAFEKSGNNVVKSNQAMAIAIG
jgi:hypothetical protein